MFEVDEFGQTSPKQMRLKTIEWNIWRIVLFVNGILEVMARGTDGKDWYYIFSTIEYIYIQLLLKITT